MENCAELLMSSGIKSVVVAEAPASDAWLYSQQLACATGQAAVVVGHSSNCLGGWIHLVPLQGELTKFKLQRNSLQFEKPSDPVSCSTSNLLLRISIHERSSSSAFFVDRHRF